MCQIEPQLRYRDFLILKRWQPPPPWILTFLTVGHVKKFELRHHAKFRRNRMKRGQNMAIFRFFKMAAAAILIFEISKILTVKMVNSIKLRHCVKSNRS